MIQTLKRFILLTVASSTLLVPVVATAFVATASADITAICQGTNDAGGDGASGNATQCGTAGSGSTDSLTSIAGQVVNIFSIIVGITAVIMIIYGGFRYITSGGDSGRVGNAKNTLIYALVGLIVVALAQFLVHYVLNTVGNSGVTAPGT
jgi:tellurite resistance protein TehA-like permease